MRFKKQEFDCGDSMARNFRMVGHDRGDEEEFMTGFGEDS